MIEIQQTCMSLGDMAVPGWLVQACHLVPYVSHNWGVLKRACSGEVLFES